MYMYTQYQGHTHVHTHTQYQGHHVVCFPPASVRWCIWSHTCSKTSGWQQWYSSWPGDQRWAKSHYIAVVTSSVLLVTHPQFYRFHSDQSIKFWCDLKKLKCSSSVLTNQTSVTCTYTKPSVTCMYTKPSVTCMYTKPLLHVPATKHPEGEWQKDH